MVTPLRHLQPLAAPDPLDALPVHCPAHVPQQRRDPTVAIPPVALRQLDDVRRQRRFVVRSTGRFPLG
jgi:hypothetical protein